MRVALLCILAVLPGALATILEHFGGPLRLAERHHSHHDTYVVSPDFTRSIVVAMLVVGCLGVLLAAFCFAGVFGGGHACVLAFTDAFTVTMFVSWLFLTRYKVSLFEDRCVITPFIGRDNCFFYSDVTSLDWAGLRRSSGYRDLVVTERNGNELRIWGIVDIEQVLLHMDRFDVLQPLAAAGEGALDTLDMRIGTWQPLEGRGGAGDPSRGREHGRGRGKNRIEGPGRCAGHEDRKNID